MKTYVRALVEINKSVVRIGLRIDDARANNPAAASDPLIATLERNRETWTLLCNAAQLAGIRDEPLLVPTAEFPAPKAIPNEQESGAQPCCSVCGFPLVSGDDVSTSEPGIHTNGNAHSPCFVLSQIKP